MRMRQAIDDFLRYCTVEKQLSQHTLQAYGADLSDFARRLTFDAAVAELNPDALRNYLDDMVVSRRLAVATIKRRFACLRLFSRWLMAAELLADPFAEWKLQLPRRKRLPRSLSRHEALSLCQAKPVRRTRLSAAPATIVQLMVSTGVRVGELCQIRIDDISPDGASIRIHGKGSRDRVAYVADPMLRERLKNMVIASRVRSGTSEMLFLNRRGAPLKPQSVRVQLRRHARNAGILRKVTPHMLRHTAATLLIESGVDIRFVQRLLGHSSIATTEIYTHVSDEALRTTLERANVLAGFRTG